MSSWLNNGHMIRRRVFRDMSKNATVKINSIHLPIIESTEHTVNNIIENEHTLKEIIISYGFNFVVFKNPPIANAMGIGDLLWNILHLQNKIWDTPLYINIFYYTNTRYYPQPTNALIFRLELLSDILDNHYSLDKSNVIFYIDNIMSERYNTSFKYNKIKSFNINSKINFPIFNNDDDEYIIFHTKLRLSHIDNYRLIKENIKNFCNNFKSKYTIYILGEQYMPKTAESEYVGITTIYNELYGLSNNNKVVDMTKYNIYENLNYSNFKKDISIFKKAKYNIHFGLGGQLSCSLIFAENIIHYVPDITYMSEFINNPELKKYKCFDNFDKFTEHINYTLGYNSIPSHYISYISGGRLGDFIFQLSVIHANYIKTGKKGILYIANIGDKFVRGVETAYNDIKELIISQEYIEDFKIYNGEQYDINLSTWRDTVFNNNYNWIELYRTTFNINFGITKWIDSISINPELQDKILINFSLQRENTHINIHELLNKYDSSKLCFICLNEDEYNNFRDKTLTNIPFIYCKDILELCISINSCELFIGNFSAPLCVALAQHKKCIGIAPTDPKHNIDLVLIKDIEKQWSHFSIIY